MNCAVSIAAYGLLDHIKVISYTLTEDKIKLKAVRVDASGNWPDRSASMVLDRVEGIKCRSILTLCSLLCGDKQDFREYTDEDCEVRVALCRFLMGTISSSVQELGEGELKITVHMRGQSFYIEKKYELEEPILYRTFTSIACLLKGYSIEDNMLSSIVHTPSGTKREVPNGGRCSCGQSACVHSFLVETYTNSIKEFLDAGAARLNAVRTY